MLLGSEQDAPG